jgi:hypothetical protein
MAAAARAARGAIGGHWPALRIVRQYRLNPLGFSGSKIGWRQLSKAFLSGGPA